MNYRDYFNIDPEYFSSINQAVIDSNPDIWEKYYPHETFVKLIKDTVNVLSRKQKLSIWVEGSYGTGKSHAVLTLKRLLDASEEDTHAYFEKYPEQLNHDLYNQFQRLKSGENKIITVHRYGSSSIYNDNSLVYALQESIEQALSDNGIKSKGAVALKESVIAWLSQPWAKDAVNKLIDDRYSNMFGGDDVDAIIENLHNFTGDALVALMDKISKIGDENQFKALSLDINGLVQWIKDVIKENDLKAIVFIWDEFTNYFERNLKALTGFQQIVEISATDPFYMIIVTHKSTGIFDDTDKDQKRILDRFVKPTCNISLPENMAFHLMGQAMVKKNDSPILENWKEITKELYQRTEESRKLVKDKTNVTDNELKNILPIHPYAALLLKHISSAFDSNQRSMFDFIKNDRGDEIKGFQWYIDNYGPEEENPLLTVDMLWDFFYEKGKENLSVDIRSILDCYPRVSKELTRDEKRVLKAVLLLQSISQQVGDAVDLFVPNEKNINNAFEGSDLHIGDAGRIAKKLCRDGILYSKSIGGNKVQFSAWINAEDTSAIEKIKNEILKKDTSELIVEGNISEAINFGGALKLRYQTQFVSSFDFRTEVNKLRNREVGYAGKITAVIALAKDDRESAAISKMIEEFLEDGSYHMIFIDASITPLGKDNFEQYADAMAHAQYHRKRDYGLAEQYENSAKAYLRKWKNRITEEGEFILSYFDLDGKKIRERINTIEQLYIALAEINKRNFGNSLETGTSVIDEMWFANALKSGIEYGASQITKGIFSSKNPQTTLENYIGKDIWQQPKGEKPYWESKPYLLISKIKIQVENSIKKGFDAEGRVSIQQIYNDLKIAPFGFMPCNLTAFVMGFVLKEYKDGKYSWSDGIKNEPLTMVKLKEMVEEVIKLQTTPNSRYRNKYIVKLTEEQKAFNEASSIIFEIPLEHCTNLEQTRERIRNEMKKLSFPIWVLKYTLETSSLKTDRKFVEKLISLYVGVANNQNFGKNKSDNDIALEIGKLCMKHINLPEDLKAIRTKEKCMEGMKSYLSHFEDGILLQLAEKIGDNGQYINILRRKFDADAANWVWSEETAREKIKEVILEYRIIAESNKVLARTTCFDDMVKEWSGKCNYIRMSYLASKNYLGSLNEFLGLLYSVKKSGNIQDSQKQKFYELVAEYGNGFQDFYNNQLEVFKQVCSHYIETYDFTSEEMFDLYQTLPTDCFIREKADYLGLVESKVAEFNSKRSSAKLKKLWFDKTGTDSPKGWSLKHRMPILCIIGDKQFREAKNAFDTINNKKTDVVSIEKALEYLESTDIFDKIINQEVRDNAFKSTIIKNLGVMLTDIEEVKDYLEKRITAEAYDWLGLPEVDRKLQQLAEAKYNQSGFVKALEKIDHMDELEVKKYLKELIKDNMTVGMEIMKEN